MESTEGRAPALPPCPPFCSALGVGAQSCFEHEGCLEEHLRGTPLLGFWTIHQQGDPSGPSGPGAPGAGVVDVIFLNWGNPLTNLEKSGEYVYYMSSRFRTSQSKPTGPPAGFFKGG